MKRLFSRSIRDSEQGFSLVELAVVIVIIGIIVAIAVPVFTGMQSAAKGATLDAAAGNGAAMVAASIAMEEAIADRDISELKSSTVSSVRLTKPEALTELDLTNYCVTATDGDLNVSAGPGCD